MSKENEIWSAFLSGNKSALGELYHELFEPLVFTAFYFVKNNEIARDIVSDLFVQLLETSLEDRQRKWSSLESVKGYLSMAIKNKSIDSLRKSKNRASIDRRILPDDKVEMDVFSNEPLTILNGQDQKIMHLHLAGYKNKEIAEQSKLSEKTVRNKLSLIRKKIGESLKFFLI